MTTMSDRYAGLKRKAIRASWRAKGPAAVREGATVAYAAQPAMLDAGMVTAQTTVFEARTVRIAAEIVRLIGEGMDAPKAVRQASTMSSPERIASINRHAQEMREAGLRQAQRRVRGARQR